MPFWLLVLVLVTLIALCWGGGWGWYRGNPAGGPWGPGLLGLLGLILFIVLVMMFVGGGGVFGPVNNGPVIQDRR